MKIKNFRMVTLLFMLPLSLLGQKLSDQKIDQKDQLEVINEFGTSLVKHYIYEDTARMMGTLLSDRLKAGEYAHIQSAREFAKALTNDLRANFRDRHISLRYDPSMVKILNGPSAVEDVSQEEIQEQLEIEIYENFRIPEVKRYNGNIGYLKIDMILPPNLATGYAEKVAAAIELVADTDAVILDLRENGGGFAEGVALILSYFFEPNTHIFNSMTRTTEGMKTEKEYTLQEVLGRRLLTQQVFVLISPQTGSAAEAIAHAIHYSGRGTLIGQNTYGAGYRFDDHLVNEKLNFTAQIPNAAVIHPNATSNWESVGVKPDVAASQEGALEVARQLAIEHLLQKEKSKPEKEKYAYRLNSLEWEANRLTDLKRAFVLSDQEIKEFLGNYASREITSNGGELFYQRKNPDRIKSRLIPVNKDEFLIEGVDQFRIKFNRDKKTNEVESIRVYSIDRVYIDMKD